MNLEQTEKMQKTEHQAEKKGQKPSTSSLVKDILFDFKVFLVMNYEV